MQIHRNASFTASRAWGSRLLLDLGEFHARVHWTDEPYRWHENSGEEVFLVLDGEVDMHYETAEGIQVVRLGPGDSATVLAGERHVAHPRGAARILVIERKDSD
jgi:mannose-6-phosphate isomerase-like protein (cupin superfamily)